MIQKCKETEQANVIRCKCKEAEYLAETLNRKRKFSMVAERFVI